MPSRPSSSAPAARGAQLLSNGRYTVLLTPSGSGFSRWRDLAVTRWREDPTCDGWGSYVLLRDATTGAVWSATLQPCGDPPTAYSATLTDARAAFVRRDGALATTLDVAIAADRDAELRRITIANDGRATRDIALTSYAELVMGPAAADAAHPAFSKLFVQTESVEEGSILLATRRRSAPDQPEVWAAHFATAEGQELGAHEFDTDRARFVGRGRRLPQAVAMRERGALAGSSGSVLDPIFSVRRRVRVAPGASVRVAFWTVMAESRNAALALAGSLRAAGAGEDVLTGAADFATRERARLGIAADEAERWAHLVSPLVSATAAWRSPPEALERGRGGPPTLWACGISGDRPIVLLRIADAGRLDRVQELLRAQRYWRSKRLGVDVVVLNTAPAGTADALHARLDAALTQQQSLLQAQSDSTPAGAFLLRDAAIADAQRDGLATVARVILDASSGATRWPAKTPRVTRSPRAARAAPILPPPRDPAHADPAPGPTPPSAPLDFDNGTGGFAGAEREYAITLTEDRCTPAPWVNVIANPSFGCIVSAEGGGYTWSINSQQNALTPWPNDPVSDPPHDVLYLRDEESGELWSATALPIRVPSAIYTVRHGKGYSRFSHEAYGIALELLQCVPVDDSVKLSRLRIYNRSGRPRRLSIVGYVEWALGANGGVPAPFVVTTLDGTTGAVFARNAWRADFGERVAFVDLGGAQSSCTGDRAEFLGVRGAVDRPAALARSTALSGRVGAGLDPCAALRSEVALAPDARTEILFVLGDAASSAQAQALVKKYRAADVDAVLRDARAQWDAILDTVQVHTPDRAMDLLLNDWLLYQTLGCRLWARTAYYQASGAYGFRDQLQDVMALCVAAPRTARAHLLRAAGRQFVEGDVQHWWLPPSGQGIRTRISDDRIWLPYVAAHYIGVTGDAAVLDAVVPFLEGAAIAAGAADAFFQPAVATEQTCLYEHCARALDGSLTLGAHGLPLMGTGDWNDGMNRVGAQGRGESVWVGWFLLAAIDAFAPHAESRGERDRAERWRHCAAAVRVALDSAGWDGQWYRRGYYDDGTPLGSIDSSECKIDTIAQSWSVIAGAASRAHAVQAMAAVSEHLIEREHQLALLFTPPFDRTSLDPGYIKGYPPGIRENGGQYTHGAVWSIFAFCMLGQGDRAAELFALLNPITHTSTPDAAARYRVEPYVTCADVYSVAPHIGRGGWTWYTGSAGWLYRAGLEAILGFRVQGTTLVIDPCVPPEWRGYEIAFRHRGPDDRVTRYEIAVENPAGVSRGVKGAELDGVEIADAAARIPLADDGGVHRVRVVLG